MTALAKSARKDSRRGMPSRKASRRARISRPPGAITSGIAVLGVFLLWEIVSTHVVDSVFLPSAIDTAHALVSLLVEDAARREVLLSVARIGAGFAVGSALGIVLGGAMGLSRISHFVVEPQVNFLRFITPLAWITPVTIWLGIGERTTLFLVVYATSLPVCINTAAAVRAIKPNRIRMARTFLNDRASAIVRRVVVPSMVPRVLTGMRLGLSYAFMTVAGVEMLTSTSGLGSLIYSARIFFDVDMMFAGIILLGMMGYVSDQLFVRVSSKFFGRFSDATGVFL